jgi:signal transduction histidine kinase
LFVDEQSVLWVTTLSGLGRWENGRWTRYTTHNGLASDNLGYLLDDGEGNLWIGSNLGLLRVPKRELNEFARGAVKSIPCRAYGKPDELPTRACTFGSQPGAWRGSNGTLWFPTSKGVAALNLAQFRPNTNPPPVVIEGVLVDDAPRKESVDQRGSTNLVLHPGDERLEIYYASLNLSAPDRARFRYRLAGYEKEWREAAGNPGVARYEYKLMVQLAPCHYTFQVLASNEDGVWNETGTSLAILVQPPFWRTWWFLGATVLCAVGLIAGIVHYFSTQRLQRQVAILRQQEALEKERARIARDIHDQVGASLTQVALLGELVETDKDSPREVQAHAQQISEAARETTRALDEIVWTVNPENDTLEGLVNYICKYAQDYLAVAGLRYRFDLPARLPVQPIAPDVRHNVFLASKEAVTNIVRHAKATSAWIRLRLEHDSFTLEIEDNGRGVAGLDPNAPQTRNGLRNMRKRMKEIGGSFKIGAGSEGGALVCLKVPLSSSKTVTASTT